MTNAPKGEFLCHDFSAAPAVAATCQVFWSVPGSGQTFDSGLINIADNRIYKQAGFYRMVFTENPGQD